METRQGIFAGIAPNVQQVYAPIETFVDAHFVGPNFIGQPGGTLQYAQTHTYQNLRAAKVSQEFVIPNSGYRITQTVNAENGFKLTTVKVGADVGAGQKFGSGAGAVVGDISGTVGP